MEDGGGAGLALVILVFSVVCLVVLIGGLVGAWKVFEKAGRPGWASIIPIYNIVVICEIVGRPVWWVALTFVPCIGLVVGIILAVDLAQSFGKSWFPYVIYPLIGFSDARYLGPAAMAGALPYGQQAYPPQALGYPASGPQYPQQGGYPQQGQPAQQQCMRCGAGVPVGGRACPQCGTPLG